MHVAGIRFSVLNDKAKVGAMLMDVAPTDDGKGAVIFFDERVNVFIGSNASGKTNILKTLQGALPVEHRSLWFSDAPKLILKDWPFAEKRERQNSRFGFQYPAQPVTVPVITVPAVRLGIGSPSKERVRLRNPEVFLAAEGHEVNGIGPGEMATLLLTRKVDDVLYAEQVQHATDLLIKLAEHKAQNDVLDGFDRRLTATKLIAGRKIDDLCVQLTESVSKLPEPTSWYDRLGIWRAWLSNFPDTQALATELDVSNDEVCLAISRLNEESNHWVFNMMAEQASYVTGIEDEDAFMYASNVTSRAFANLHKAVKLSQICAKQICDGILADDRPGHISYQIEDDIQGIARDQTRIIQDVVIGVTPFIGLANDPDGPDYGTITRQPAYKLSAGTESTLWWVRFIAFNMLYHANFKFGWEKQPAILLIDEIENHLHPTWQRRVIPALLKYFPGLQIFATTHSPFAIAGLKAGQVHLLNRDADGFSTASTNTEDIIGWTADEILRVFMGVDDPTDDATAAAARELRQLRDAGPHPDEREEERRQARMQELRQLVNRELLAGSVRAAEDERFAENLTRILEKYRLSKDLNQENG